MYLKYFDISEYPFSLSPDTSFFCELPGHQAALNMLLVSLRSGEGFIKVVGEVGTGKTMLCRLLLKKIAADFTTAYIPNPDLSPDELRKALATELELDINSNIGSHDLLSRINACLVESQRQSKPVVLLIDEAQTMSDASLEALRLLTNLETATTRLLQVVLFAQPELDEKLAQHHLRQLRQRIVFSCYLPPITRQDLTAYISYRLNKAGYSRNALFTVRAIKCLYKASGGLPRLVNILCHKAMIVTYGTGQHRVTRQAMLSAIEDTEGVATGRLQRLFWFFAIATPVILLIALFIHYVFLPGSGL